MPSKNKSLATFEMMTMDAVIAWVDGNDPKHKAKIQQFISNEQVAASPNVIPSRYDSSGEILYCVLSILKFAPYIRNIFIVSDGQKPRIEEHVQKYFPSRLKDIHFIDHKIIFRGYERYLPVFNSRAIETMTWQIPSISENYLYFNDDFFLIKPTSLDDWFQKGKLILRGKWHPIPFHRILWHEYIVPAKKRRASFHLGMWNAAKKAGSKHKYFVFEHTPYLISKKELSQFYSRNPQALISNISYRFRNPQQFNPNALSQHLSLLNKNAITQSDSQLSYLQPSKRGENYILDKIHRAESNENIKFMCVQDLSISSEKQCQQVFDWLKTIILS